MSVRKSRSMRRPSGPTERRLLRGLDDEGTPTRSPLEDWWAELAATVGQEWDDDSRTTLAGFARSALRFTRPDGSMAFGPMAATNRRDLWKALDAALYEPGLGTVNRWWFAARGSGASSPPPLPAFGLVPRPLAVLRANWAKDGDFIALDGRETGRTRFELTVAGQPMLGPEWPGPVGRKRLVDWSSHHEADFAEWSVGAGRDRLVRSAVLLRGRKLALLGEETATRAGSASFRIALSDGVEAKADADGAGLWLRRRRGPSVRVLPIGLEPGRGALTVEDGHLVLSTFAAGPRAWLPLLFSWDAERDRRAALWRVLTVSQKSKATRPGVAFAARAAWGRADGWVVYRSLGRPAARAFLGHPTESRFLIGRFSDEGNVTAVLTRD